MEPAAVLLRKKRFSFFLLPPLRTVLGTWNDHSTEALLTLAITISAELVVTDPSILIKIEVPLLLIFLWHPGHIITSDLHYDVFKKEITDNIKRPPGREKMYDPGAKMDVFLRCNAIKMFKGRTIPCISFWAEFRNCYSFYFLTAKDTPNCSNNNELFQNSFSLSAVLRTIVIHLLINDNAIANLFLRYSAFSEKICQLDNRDTSKYCAII